MSFHSSIQTSVQRFIEADQNHDFQLSADELKKVWGTNETFNRSLCRKLNREIRGSGQDVHLASFMEKMGQKQYSQGTLRYFADPHQKEFIDRFKTKISDEKKEGHLTPRQAAAFIAHAIKNRLSSEERRALETEELIRSLDLGLHAEDVRSNASHLVDSASSAEVQQAFKIFKEYFPSEDHKIDAYFSLGAPNIGRFILYLASQKNRLRDLSGQGLNLDKIQAQLISDYHLEA